MTFKTIKDKHFLMKKFKKEKNKRKEKPEFPT